MGETRLDAVLSPTDLFRQVPGPCLCPERLEMCSGSFLVAGELRAASETGCAARPQAAVDAKVRRRTQSAPLRQVAELRRYPLSRSAVCSLARSARAKIPRQINRNQICERPET